MKLRVTRTSKWWTYDDDGETSPPPCDEAALEGERKPWTEPLWFVELDTLDELRSLVAKYGPCVLEMRDDGLRLEIYDAYRE